MSAHAQQQHGEKHPSGIFRFLGSDWETYAKLASFLKPYRFRLALGLLAGIGYAACNSGIILLVRTITDTAFHGKFSQSDLLKGAGMGQGGGVTEFLWMILPIPLVMILRGLLAYANVYNLTWVSLRALRDMRRRVFGHLMRQSLDFFGRSQSGRLLSRVLNDTQMAQESLVSIVGELVKQPLTAIGVIAVLLRIDWKFCLFAFVLFPLFLLPVIIYGRRVRKAARAVQNEAGVMAVILQESFAGIRVIKSFAREAFQLRLFDKSSDEQFRSGMKVKKSTAIVQPMMESVSACGVALALVYVHYSHLSIGSFIALLMGMFLLYDPIKNLSRIHVVLQNCLGAATSTLELLDTKPSIHDLPGAMPLETTRGHLAFEGVNFSYGTTGPHGEEGGNAVTGISLVIEPGMKVALVGSSGAGKSTLLALLLRFYDPQQGRILIDGRDLRDLTLLSLREQIGIVTQESFLFHDSIYENIRFGRLDATKAEIEEAARLAHAHDFIMAQPHGYETVVGDKGCLLSGGQQQRLAIARALLKAAPVLLLDEATSALDSESEKMIQDALEKLSRGRTVIAIAHRLSTVLGSDMIVVMDHGRIVATGTHAELLNSSEVYTNLYRLQFSH
ncbi:MAG: ABC transporter ATP-binding protein [Chthoniobacterales bacterium]|jgi:subfamily B ATP-binding cassette protein MsbA